MFEASVAQIGWTVILVDRVGAGWCLIAWSYLDGDEDLMKDKLHFFLFICLLLRATVFFLRFVIRLVLG